MSGSQLLNRYVNATQEDTHRIIQQAREENRLLVIDEASFAQYLCKEPDKVRTLLQQMSTRLRRISRDCADACRPVSDVVEAEKRHAARHRSADPAQAHQRMRHN